MIRIQNENKTSFFLYDKKILLKRLKRKCVVLSMSFSVEPFERESRSLVVVGKNGERWVMTPAFMILSITDIRSASFRVPMIAP